MEQFPIHIPSDDPSDTSYQFLRSVQFVVEVPAWLRHRNAHGEEGARVVKVVRLTPYGNDFEIATYEEPGRVFHTFLASRVLEFVDIATGERVDDVVAFLTEIHRRSTRGQVFLALRKLAPEMLVLVAIARASGQLREKQRAPILAYARRQASEFQIDADRFADDLAMVGSEGESVASALRTIKVKGAEHAADVLAVAEAVAATRSGAREETDKVLARVRKALARRGTRMPSLPH